MKLYGRVICYNLIIEHINHGLDWVKMIKSSRKTFKFRNIFEMSINICGMFGHVWEWEEKYPNVELHKLSKPPFKEPFYNGFAWACKRDGCENWLSVSQIRSNDYIPYKKQKTECLGEYGSYYLQ